MDKRTLAHRGAHAHFCPVCNPDAAVPCFTRGCTVPVTAPCASCSMIPVSTQNILIVVTPGTHLETVALLLLDKVILNMGTAPQPRLRADARRLSEMLLREANCEGLLPDFFAGRLDVPRAIRFAKVTR